MTEQTRTDSAPLFELSGGHARYRSTAVLDDLNLRIETGERVALLGRSGVGKTTLLRLIYQSLQKQQRNVALIPQEPGLVDNLSVWHNIYMGRLDRYSAAYNVLNLFLRRRDRDAEISALANTLQIVDVLKMPSGETSGGQQQRTAIGRALYREADIIIADEPIANLDQPTAELCMQLINAHCSTSVIALHDPAIAQRYCSRIVGLRDGRITLDCPAAAADSGELSLLYSDATG